ncbi:MAG: hypothetical protein OKBPIBMD_01230 [Chlorobi bacterium]|nr:hypothetical protein [Chlorobiota bacterium]MBW7853654.1 OmpA family protein [Candidatus Kapabacteria bacterium]MCL4276711.1 OmpA family protein [Ignavibacteria bacterium]QOJ25673.1 MAG: OmpA family protein [Ignavibacteria bacterium]WKZ77597.1 MAG: OmpA family protein [Candidatus Kapabacteria bacterium]
MIKTPFLTALIVLLFSTLNAAAQHHVSVSQAFATQPPYWTWMEPYRDQNVEKFYSNGFWCVDQKTDNNSWGIFYGTIDVSRPFKFSVSLITDRVGQPSAGGGITISSGEWMYFFKVEMQNKAYWIGRWKSAGNVWETLSEQGPGNTSPAAPPLRGLGLTNTLSVEIANQTCTFSVNGTPVFSKAATGGLADLTISVGGVGILNSGSTRIRFQSYELDYYLGEIPLVHDAFKGATKTYMEQLQGPGARYPVISPNGKQLYFIKNVEGTNDDIWVANALTDSTWSDPVNIGAPLNNTDPNNVISVSQDGNELFLWGLYNANGTSRGGGFSTAQRSASGWSVPVEVRNQHQQNRSSTREECLTADRKVMIAARQIDGMNHGGKDLYVSFLQSNGEYGPLINLGTAINSPGNEGGPYLAADGRTLYYTSSATGYGNDDIFVSKRLDDTWTNWSPRVNLGPSINTNAWDSYFTIHPNGKYAYMNTTDGFKGGIYRITLPQDPISRTLLPNPVVIVSGKVYDAKTRQPLSVMISYENLRTSQKIGSAISNPRNGEYSIVLTGGTSYGIYAEHSGYFPISENLPIESVNAFTEIKKDLYLEPIAVGSAIRLNNLFFDTDKSDLRSESTTELQRLVQLLSTYPTMAISIEGHTDDRGSEAHNDKLSEARARAVYTWLVNHNVPASRLSARGFGKRKPVEKATSDEARQMNRRVEFRIVSM